MNGGFSASCGGLDKKVPKDIMQFSRCLVDMHLNHISQVMCNYLQYSL
jgi:hypothetical protein